MKCEEIKDFSNRKWTKGTAQIYEDDLYVYERMEEGDTEPQLWRFNLSKSLKGKIYSLNRKAYLEIL